MSWYQKQLARNGFNTDGLNNRQRVFSLHKSNGLGILINVRKITRNNASIQWNRTLEIAKGLLDKIFLHLPLYRLSVLFYLV